MIRVVAALLLIWEPLNFAVGALTALPTIVYRGWMAATELAAHGVVAAVATSAALALWNTTSAAPSSRIDRDRPLGSADDSSNLVVSAPERHRTGIAAADLSFSQS